jgi:hypothetical protein
VKDSFFLTNEFLLYDFFWLAQVFQATSPNGRFVNGAIVIIGHVLSHIETHGKNIFYVRILCSFFLSLHLLVMECFWSCYLAWLECLKNEINIIKVLHINFFDGTIVIRGMNILLIFQIEKIRRRSCA